MACYRVNSTFTFTIYYLCQQPYHVENTGSRLITAVKQHWAWLVMGWGGTRSSVGIATDYGLDGPGSNPGGDEFFRPSRPVLGPTQPPVKWVPGLSRGEVWPGRAADHSLPSSAEVMEE